MCQGLGMLSSVSKTQKSQIFINLYQSYISTKDKKHDIMTLEAVHTMGTGKSGEVVYLSRSFRF